MAEDLVYQKIDPHTHVKQRQLLIRCLTDPSKHYPAPNLFAAYSLLFSEILPKYIVHSIQSLFDMHLMQGRQDGYIYVFRDNRDPQHYVKIGKTKQPPSRRLQQWKAKLRSRSGDIDFVCALPCAHMSLAEDVLHTLFLSNHIEVRFNKNTYERHKEYFCISDWSALRYVCQCVVLNINQAVKERCT